MQFRLTLAIQLHTAVNTCTQLRYTLPRLWPEDWLLFPVRQSYMAVVSFLNIRLSRS